MARRTIDITLGAEGKRDAGKVFRLTEMPASQAERWAARAFFGAAAGGVEIPDNLTNSGMAGIAHLGFNFIAKLPWAVAEPLLEEMFTCVMIIPDPSKPMPRVPFEEDIQEIATRVRLRMEVFKLHVDFSEAAAP